MNMLPEHTSDYTRGYKLVTFDEVSNADVVIYEKIVDASYQSKICGGRMGAFATPSTVRIGENLDVLL